MRSGLCFTLLLPLAALLGCTVSSTPSSTSPTPIPTPTGNWDNWQIQAGSAINSPPSTYPNFVGAVQVQGSQASAIFTSEYSSTVSSQILSYTGTFDSTKQALSFVTNGWAISFIEPATPYTSTPVDVLGGCIYPPTYTGVECNAIFEVASVGVQIAPLDGTYVGTLTDSAAPSMSGTGTLTLTQSSTPNASGQFPLTGTVTFPAGSDLNSYPLTGTISGEGLTLNYCSAAVIGPCVSLTGSANPAATQIAVPNLTWAQTGPSYTFTGTLIRQ